jgi:glutamyl-tRNA reductase
MQAFSPGTYIVCGVSFHASPIEVRERVAIGAALMPQATRFLLDQPGVNECMVLSTCNRTELYLAADEWVDGADLFDRFARKVRGCDVRPCADQIYVHRGDAAVAHLFRVVSSLDSLIVGEPQILGQAKNAFREAEKLGAVGRELHRLMPRAFAAAKQVRTETGICEAAVSVSYAAVQLARKIFEDLSGKSVVLLGAGKMGELAALHLKEAGAASIAVANRTLARAEEVAARCSGTAVDFGSRSEQIARADVVICSTDAPEYVLDQANLSMALRQRARRALLILDISVPRNVDPRVSDLTNVYLFNVDDLESVVRANREARHGEAARAEAILDRSLVKFRQEESQSRMAPAIAAIRNQVRAVCMAELERYAQRAPLLAPEEREELEFMLHRIAQKIVHPAIMELKSADSLEAAGDKLNLVEKLFGIC